MRNCVERNRDRQCALRCNLASNFLEANAELTESRIARNCGGPQRSELPSQILSISSRVQRHLHGDLQNFRDIPVDLDSAGGPVVRRVCEAYPRDSRGTNRYLCRYRCKTWPTLPCPGRWTRSRQESYPPHHPLPPSYGRPWKTRRLFRLWRPSHEGETARNRRRRGESLLGTSAILNSPSLTHLLNALVEIIFPPSSIV